MKKYAIINIQPENAKYCGACEWLHRSFCNLYNKSLARDDNGKIKRWVDCLGYELKLNEIDILNLILCLSKETPTDYLEELDTKLAELRNLIIRGHYFPMLCYGEIEEMEGPGCCRDSQCFDMEICKKKFLRLQEKLKS